MGACLQSMAFYGEILNDDLRCHYLFSSTKSRRQFQQSLSLPYYLTKIFAQSSYCNIRVAVFNAIYKLKCMMGLSFRKNIIWRRRRQVSQIVIVVTATISSYLGSRLTATICVLLTYLGNSSDILCRLEWGCRAFAGSVLSSFLV